MTLTPPLPAGRTSPDRTPILGLKGLALRETTKEQPMIPARQTLWIAELRPARLSLDELLDRNLHFDVWERHSDFLKVVASEAVLAGIEGQGIAIVNKLSTTKEFAARKLDRANSSGGRE
jgi:hypothetical protein